MSERYLLWGLLLLLLLLGLTEGERRRG